RRRVGVARRHLRLAAPQPLVRAQADLPGPQGAQRAIGGVALQDGAQLAAEALLCRGQPLEVLGAQEERIAVGDLWPVRADPARAARSPAPRPPRAARRTEPSTISSASCSIDRSSDTA